MRFVQVIHPTTNWVSNWNDHCERMVQAARQLDLPAARQILKNAHKTLLALLLEPTPLLTRALSPHRMPTNSVAFHIRTGDGSMAHAHIDPATLAKGNQDPTVKVRGSSHTQRTCMCRSPIAP